MMQKYISFFSTILLILLVNFSIIAQTAAFTADKTEGCSSSPLAVIFTNQSVGSNLTYMWNFGDGVTSTSPDDPTHTYQTPGIYTVTLICSNLTTSDTLIKIAYIKYYKAPVANFTQDKTQGCNPLTVNFTNLSALGDTTLSSIVWTFGDAQSSTDYSPAPHIYSNPGNFSVSLFLTDYHGCTSNKTSANNISVIENNINASFSIDKPFGCDTPHTVALTNATSDTTLTYNWYFGDNSTSNVYSPMPHTYPNFGTYPISLVVSGAGCTDSIVKNVTINSFIGDFKIDTTAGCKPFSAHFTNLTTGSTTWKWNFGDGTSATTQNPAHTFDTTGTYNVTLIVGNANCSDTIIKSFNIVVYPKPLLNFIALDSTACSIPFDANFSTSGDSVETWSWTFTGGVPSSSTEQNPIITYNDSLDYSVSLTVVDSNNCSASLTKTNYIKINLPHAKFGFDSLQGCKPLFVTFIDSSTSVEDITHWYWDFGDGTPIIDQLDPTHIFADTGVFSVNLIIENIKGCRDSVLLTDTIFVGDHKNVLFSPTDSSGCYKFILPFTDLSDSVGDEWLWDFGDGGTSTEQNPTHTYADTGYFDVSLIVGFHGCYDFYSLDSVAWVFPPIARFTPSTLIGCDTPLVVTFTDESVLADYWEWDFGNGQSFIGQNITDTITYSIQGFYDVWLKVGNSTYGCMDSIKKVISISDIHVGFDTDTTKGCMPFLCQFTDTSWTNTSFTKWDWTFGDGNTFDTTEFYLTPHTYLINGFYDVTLEVTDQLGCLELLKIDSLIEVKNLPSPGFVADITTGCVSLPVQFTDTTNFITPTKSWLWNFGDGVNSLDTNASHTYNQRGVYNVTLTLTDTNNCVGTITQNNYIAATYPFPDFTFNPVACNNQSVSFTSTSTSTPNAIGDTLLYEWDFGDNSPVSTLSNPTHSFSTNADTAVSFNIELKVTDRNGCDSTIIKTITISDIKAGFYADGTVATCPDFFVHFTDSTKTTLGTLTSWLWDFGNNAPLIDTIDDPYNTYTESGIYDVQLIVGNNYGCMDTLKIDSLIKVQGPTGSLMYDIDTSTCTPVFTFHAVTDNAVKYFWDFGDQSSSENYVDFIEHVYLISGTYDPIVIFEDNNECKGSAKLDNPIVVDFPYVPVSFDSIAALCTSPSGSATVIPNGTKPPYSYLWSNDGTSATINNLIFGEYFVTVSDSIGCLGGGKVTVPQTMMTFLNNFTKTNEICIGANGKATSSPSAGLFPYSYLWNTNSFADSATNLSQGTYYLTITDANGCIKIDSVVIGRDFNTYLSNITKKDIMCKDKSGIVSVAPDGTSPFSYSWNTGAYSYAIMNLDTGKYSVTITDALGCIITDSANVDLLTNVTINADYYTDTNNVLSITPINFISTSTDSIPIISYTWNIDEKTFTDTIGLLKYKFEEAGIYEVMLKIIDEYGCIDSFITSITIRDGLEVPNVFSPNGDGENDVFYLHHSGIEQFKIDIFNRWGVLLFTETAPKIYWTGKTTAGVDVPSGVYYYIIEATSVLGEVYKLQGNIQLFR